MDLSRRTMQESILAAPMQPSPLLFRCTRYRRSCYIALFNMSARYQVHIRTAWRAQRILGGPPHPRVLIESEFSGFFLRSRFYVWHFVMSFRVFHFRISSSTDTTDLSRVAHQDFADLYQEVATANCSAVACGPAYVSSVRRLHQFFVVAFSFFVV